MDKKSYNIYILVGMIYLLYCLQGFLYGYVKSIKITLQQNGVNFEDLAIYEIITIPIYTKFLFSPFLDLHYHKKIGKRMSYIVPISLVVSVMYLILAQFMEDLINEQKVFLLTGILFFMMLLISIQDIAIDSLCEECLHEKDVHWGSLMQTMGQIVGPLISFNFYIYYMDKIQGMAVYTLITTAMAYSFIQENEKKSDFQNVTDIFKVFPNFFKNPNIRRLIIFLITHLIGFCFWGNVHVMILLSQGFEKDMISILSTVQMGASLITIAVMSRINFDKLFKIFQHSYGLLILLNVLEFLNLIYFEKYKNQQVTFIVLMLLTILEQASNFLFTCKSVYINRTCDPDASGTYLSVMNALSNIPVLMFNPIFTYLLKFDYKIVSLFFIAYSIIYYLVLFPYFMNKFDKTSKQMYQLSYKEKIDQLISNLINGQNSQSLQNCPYRRSLFWKKHSNVQNQIIIF